MKSVKKAAVKFVEWLFSDFDGRENYSREEIEKMLK